MRKRISTGVRRLTSVLQIIDNSDKWGVVLSLLASVQVRFGHYGSGQIILRPSVFFEIQSFFLMVWGTYLQVCFESGPKWCSHEEVNPPSLGPTWNLCCISFFFSLSTYSYSHLSTISSYDPPKAEMWSSSYSGQQMPNPDFDIHSLTVVCQSQCCRVGSGSHWQRTVKEMFTGGLSLRLMPSTCTR